MTLTLILTDKIRSSPYFSSFLEDEVEVPDRPFLRQLLDGSLQPEALSIPELISCLETCIYFSLVSKEIILEFLWKIGETKELFQQWFIPDEKSSSETRWVPRPHLPEIIRLELAQATGRDFTERRQIRLGIRYPNVDCWRIAREGNLRLLKWAHEKCLSVGHEGGLPIAYGSVLAAAENGHLDVLKYLHEHGCPWDQGMTTEAAKNGHLEVLQYLHKQGCPWNEWTCSEAAAGGHLDCLKYAHEQGCPWFTKIVLNAVKNNHLSCLQYLHEQGCPWDSEMPKEAAAKGHLGMLQYLHEHGCPWDQLTCLCAASGGHLDCLKYAHENGCPWGPHTYLVAAMGKRTACMDYLHKEGYLHGESMPRDQKALEWLGLTLSDALRKLAQPISDIIGLK